MKTLKVIGIAGVLCSSLCLAAVQGSSSGTQQPVQPTEQTTPILNNTDQVIDQNERSLILAVHTANIAEVKASLMVLTRPVSAEVKKFAWMIISEHVANEEKLQGIVDGYKFDLTGADVLTEIQPMLDQAKAGLEQLDATADVDFEKAYLDLMKAGHQDLVDKLVTTDVQFTHTAIGDFIKETQEAVQSHLAKLDLLDNAGSQTQVTTH